KLMRYPPATHLVSLVASAADAERSLSIGREVRSALAEPRRPDVVVLGPALAPIQRLKRAWRSQVLVKAHTRPALRDAIRAGWDRLRPFVDRGVLDIDVDPQDLL